MTMMLDENGNLVNYPDRVTTLNPQPEPVMVRAGSRPQSTLPVQPPSIPSQRPTPTQQRSGGLLDFLGNDKAKDAALMLAAGLEGMTMRPNQALQQMALGKLQERKDQRQRNATAAKLREMGRNDVADALEQGMISGKDAAALIFAKSDKPSIVQEYEYAKEQGYDGTLQDYVTSKAKAGATQTSVTVGAGDKFTEEINKDLASELGTLATAGVQASRNFASIDRLENALRDAPQGATGRFVEAASGLGIKLEGASDIEAARAIINKLVPEQRAPGSGPMSDADLALFKQSLPDIMNTPEGNARIIKTLKDIAAYDMKMGQIANDARFGRITPQEAYQRMSEMSNPLEWLSGSSTQTAGKNRIVVDY